MALRCDECLHPRQLRRKRHRHVLQERTRGIMDVVICLSFGVCQIVSGGLPASTHFAVLWLASNLGRPFFKQGRSGKAQ